MARGQTKTAPQTLLRATVWLYPGGDNQEPEPTDVVIGASERIEASRHYGEPVVDRFSRGDEEAIAYTAWLAMKRFRKYEPDFDTFVQQLAAVDVEGDDDEEGDAAGRS